MANTKLALLGCGDVAHRDYLPEFHRIAHRAEIVAVCGRSPERAQHTAQQYGIPNVYTDYAKMLRETDAEAVINLTPMQLHYETNLASLQAGKHVYTEKTAATNFQQAHHLLTASQQYSKTLICAPCIMVWPQVLLAKQMIERDEIGPVRSARGLGHGGVPPWEGFTSDPTPFFATGGGPHRDMGVYPLHALTGLLGAATHVSACALKAQPGFGIDSGPFAGKQVNMQENDTWLISLQHGHGASSGDVAISSTEANNSVQATHAAQLELFGLRGTLAVNLLDSAAPLQLYKNGQWQDVPVPHQRAGAPDHILGVQHLLDCLQHGAPPVLSMAHAAHVIEMLDGAATSASEHRAIALTTHF
jgi:predicted dehydrogenase